MSSGVSVILAVDLTGVFAYLPVDGYTVGLCRRVKETLSDCATPGSWSDKSVGGEINDGE